MILTEHSHIQSKRLQLFQQNLEGLGDTRSRDILALDDGFVGLHTSDYIIGFNSQDLLQGVGCTVCLQGPNLHLSETLSSELCLTTQRLLGNQGVRAGGTCVDLIVYQVMQFQVMHVSDGYRAVEILTGTTVTKSYLTISGKGNSFPKLAVISVLIEVIHNLRKQLFLVFCFELFPGQVHIIVGQIQGIHDIYLVCAIEYRCGDIEAQSFGSKA